MTTLKDIAKRCGVSTATVSYVLNNGPQKIMPETRERVLLAIEDMGYQPNAYARALKGVRTPVVGVVFPHVTVPFTNVYFGPALEGIVAHATERRMATMLLTGFTWEETERGAERQFSGICDGFLVVAPRENSPLVRDLALSGVPLVCVGTTVAEPSVSSIDCDNRVGGKLATEHLLALGHRRIGVVLCSDGSSRPKTDKTEQVTSFSRERYLGYADALRAWGLEAEPSLSAVVTDDPIASRAAIRRLLTESEPTAIFGCNDGAAYRTVEVCREMSILVPENLSIVGYDDIASSASFDPPLTTVRQPISKIGWTAVEMLCGQIEGRTRQVEHRVMPVELVARRSTRNL